MIWILWACGTPEQIEVLAEQQDIAPQIRLLSRREYRNTIMDVLELEVPSQASCTTDSDCALASESCSAQQCVVDDCSKVTFMYEGNPNDEVFVLGSFSCSVYGNGGGFSVVNQCTKFSSSSLNSDLHDGYAGLKCVSIRSTKSIDLLVYGFNP